MLPETTIVIAAYNEEKRLPETLTKIQAYLAATNLHAEIVVVDDGSTDNTASMVRALSEGMRGLRLISYPRNRGKGYALRKGVLSSQGRLVLVTDADLSTPIEELETLRPHLSSHGHHIAIGSRALPLSEIVEAQPPWRRGMSRLFNGIVKVLVIDGFKDTQCGFKLFTGEVARSLFHKARIDRFAYDVEILALARNHGYRVAEVPIKWKNSTASKVRPVLDSVQMLSDLVKIRMVTIGRKQGAAYAPVDCPDRSSANP
ncbi:MAG: glycosyl transferase [Geobacteraceae bacterium GWC2_58_44]|nr:MAG: glycosyl transferase [Geobacteraceae bacterium GWC2_58_44]